MCVKLPTHIQRCLQNKSIINMTVLINKCISVCSGGNIDLNRKQVLIQKHPDHKANIQTALMTKRKFSST